MKKSVDVIKKLQMKNGGILASPQGEAYPYVYIRDAVIMTKALNRMGECKCSEEFYYFVEKFSKIDKYGEIFHRYNKLGLTVLLLSFLPPIPASAQIPIPLPPFDEGGKLKFISLAATGREAIARIKRKADPVPLTLDHLVLGF